MQPSQGRIVIASGGVAVSNGSQTAPAIITRVWDQSVPADHRLVNVTVFPDNGKPVTATSARLYHDAATASAARQAQNMHESTTVLYWPARV